MARVVGTITVDLAGMAPLHRMIDSLHEALATAQVDEELEVETCRDGLLFRGCLIARISVSGPRDSKTFMRAEPTVCLPLFVSEICRIAPGVRVLWKGAWPHFSASDGDDPVDDVPDPVRPEMVDA